MPWLLNFINFVINDLPEDLNAQVICHEKEELEVAKIEGDERWSLVRNKKNDPQLWLVFHNKVGKCLLGKWVPEIKSVEPLFAKRSESLKKPSISLINLMSIMKSFLGANINQLASYLVRQATWKDLIVLSDKGVQDL